MKKPPVTNTLDTQTCCSEDGCNTTPKTESKKSWAIYLPAIISFVLLVIGIFLDFKSYSFFNGYIRFFWYLIVYLPVGLPVLRSALRNIRKGAVFTEFSLMSMATIGAFILKEYPEGVAVMLFYSVGELFQDAAVKKARGNIQALLDVSPKEAMVFRSEEYVSVSPEKVLVGEKLLVRTGEKIPLDGILLSEKGTLNTAAITGESKPKNLQKGDKVFAGSINLDGVLEMEAMDEFQNSSIARILDLVQNATARKSKTELFIRKFAKVYTPIVAFLAIAVTLVPISLSKITCLKIGSTELWCFWSFLAPVHWSSLFH